MKIKVSKHKLNIHYRGSPRGGRTQQHAYCLRYAHSQHVESHLGKKQQQAKIPIAFLFSQLHFNNVTSHALFYGGHLVMRSKRCAVQNQGITLNSMNLFWFFFNRTGANHDYKLYVKFAILNCYRYSFFVRIVNAWNNLPKDCTRRIADFISQQIKEYLYEY